MKKLLIILYLITSTAAYSQVDWANYSTSFERIGNKPSLGLAIPYNGIYDNFEKKIVGISHWNPQYKLPIDTALDEDIPLYFVYDTEGIYFLAPGVSKSNAADYEFTVLLNNKAPIIPWSPIGHFTKETIGDLEAGSAITANYHAGFGQYLVAHLRNKQKEIISSIVIYFKEKAPEIKSISTSDNALVFSSIVNNKSQFNQQPMDIGWHRQYTSNLSGEIEKLKLPYNENNVLVHLNATIYKKAALEYALFKKDKEIRKWGPNEYDNNYILLKNLEPGDYTIRIRFKRQRSGITELHFSVSSVWYESAAFKAAILCFLVLAVVLLIFFSKFRGQKQALALLNKQAEESAEALSNIHALLNPHFTFNALSSIQGLVNKGDIDAASKYLSSFGELLRETLKQGITNHIPLAKELENLTIYIGLEQLRYPFQHILNVDTNIDIYSATIPPFILQPFAENAIKHGLAGMNGLGELKVSIIRNGHTMVVEIVDNGPGFDSNSLKEGYGLGLSRKRIKILNTDYGEELITLQLESTNKGTLVLLSFKSWL